jgi:putative transposase
MAHRVNGVINSRIPPIRNRNYGQTAPNKLWSCDITKLRGPAKWTYYYLYVILDVFSRYVFGWMIASREAAALATKLIEETCDKHLILRTNSTTIRFDRTCKIA